MTECHKYTRDEIISAAKNLALKQVTFNSLDLIDEIHFEIYGKYSNRKKTAYLEMMRCCYGVSRRSVSLIINRSMEFTVIGERSARKVWRLSTPEEVDEFNKLFWEHKCLYCNHVWQTPKITHNPYKCPSCNRTINPAHRETKRVLE